MMEIFEEGNFCKTTSMKISRRKLSRIFMLVIIAWVARMRLSRNVSPPRYTTGKGRYRAHAHPVGPCDSFNQLAKKLVTRLV